MVDRAFTAGVRGCDLAFAAIRCVVPFRSVAITAIPGSRPLDASVLPNFPITPEKGKLNFVIFAICYRVSPHDFNHDKFPVFVQEGYIISTPFVAKRELLIKATVFDMACVDILSSKIPQGLYCVQDELSVVFFVLSVGFDVNQGKKR